MKLKIYEQYKNLLFEKEFSSNEIDLDKIYLLFSADYIKATGKTWTKDKFLSRARGWTFYGNEDGVIAVRKQKSGFIKLVGAAGSPKGKLLGIKELIAKKYPVWGFVSDDLLGMAKKLGFIHPPAFVIKTMLKFIDPSVFGGVDFTINKNGSITLKYNDVGEATKYFIGTKSYFAKTLKDSGKELPNVVKSFFKFL